MNTQQAEFTLTYLKELYADVLGWYHNADLKTQEVLTFSGAFLSFLAIY